MLTINALKVESRLIDGKLKNADKDEIISVLDVGAGDFSFKSANDKRYNGRVVTYGISAHDNFRSSERRQSNEHHTFNNAEYLAEIYPANKFDFIFSFRTFIHFVDPVGAIVEAYKILKPGGVLLVDEFYIPGCEKYGESILLYLKQQGYAIVTDNSHHTIKNFIIKKTEDKPELLFPVEFHKMAHSKQSGDYVKYKPSPQLKVFHDSKPDIDSFAYEKGRQHVMSQIQRKAENNIINNNASLSALFADEQYQSLDSSSQYLCILGVVAKTVDYDNINEIVSACENLDKRSPYKDNFLRLYDEIKMANQDLLSSLSSLPYFKFYHGSKSPFSKEEANEQQLRIIQIAAAQELIRVGRSEITKLELETLELPYKESRHTYFGDFLAFSELADVHSKQSKPS